MKEKRWDSHMMSRLNLLVLIELYVHGESPCTDDFMKRVGARASADTPPGRSALSRALTELDDEGLVTSRSAKQEDTARRIFYKVTGRGAERLSEESERAGRVWEGILMSALELEKDGDLITLKGTDNCLGYLMDFNEHGVHDAEYGQVDVTPADAAAHNNVLDGMILKGLDEQCQLGQGHEFYLSGDETEAKTFMGAIVGSVKKSGGHYHLTRGSMELVGRKEEKDDVCIFFMRVV